MHESSNIVEKQGWRHPSKIPAGGNGNSPNGQNWVNPTDEQLMRACRRKGKKLDHSDKSMVAAIHGEVLEKTWRAIMEYENLHIGCIQPTLSRFEGKSEVLSPKAKFYSKPFDRHDWVVDRCGKEVRYIIDYYGGDFNPSSPFNGKLIVDCRPALTLGGVFDRLHLNFKKAFL
ncbi:hypothetical protein MHBO_000959 [Bonamia ostreae]|uniref:Holocytochrome c-type synthase n=1 Tax=Bonamia ostreae TaxID=126728 RepID=A0ABV2AHK6_9EUKA